MCLRFCECFKTVSKCFLLRTLANLRILVSMVDTGLGAVNEFVREMMSKSSPGLAASPDAKSTKGASTPLSARSATSLPWDCEDEQGSEDDMPVQLGQSEVQTPVEAAAPKEKPKEKPKGKTKVVVKRPAAADVCDEDDGDYDEGEEEEGEAEEVQEEKPRSRKARKLKASSEATKKKFNPWQKIIQEHLPAMKAKHPDLANTELLKLVGEQWAKNQKANK